MTMDARSLRPVLSPSWWLARPAMAGAALVAFLAVAAVVWYLASPLFIRTRLDEAGTATGQVVARGGFTDRDAVHRGSGTASLLRAGGASVLRLDAFRVTNGPDLFVYLTPSASPNSHEDVTQGLRVGRLKAPEGTFSYELPPGTDLGSFRAAVIYCFQFRTIFSVAPLRAT